ncbi:MAG: hypothetical protein WBX00_02440 [Isosphaeraceae bacterium]
MTRPAFVRWCASAGGTPLAESGLAVLFVVGCWMLVAMGEWLRGERR